MITKTSAPQAVKVFAPLARLAVDLTGARAPGSGPERMTSLRQRCHSMSIGAA